MMSIRVLLILLLTTSQVCSQSGIDRVLADPLLGSASISISLLDIASGDEVYEHHAGTALIPASTLKVVTAITALQQLGPDYRWHTDIGYVGDLLDDGTLDGDLYIVGSGDPCLGSDRIAGYPSAERLMDLLSHEIGRQVTCITGDIVIDTRYDVTSYTPERYWLYEDLGNYYGSVSYALNIGENLYELYLDRSAGRGGRATVSYSSPPLLRMQWSSSVEIDANSSGDHAYLLAGPGQYTARVVGSIPAGKGPFAIKGALPDPPRHFGEQLSIGLRHAGIDHRGVAVRRSALDYQTITRIKSPPLSDVVTIALHRSHNLYTEALYEILTRSGHVLPDLGAGSRVVDACGLSPSNRVSSKSLASYLANLGLPSDDVLSVLPQSGVSGSLRYLLTEPPYKGHIYAKSGSMTGVLCYAGYLDTPTGWKAFAMMINGCGSEVADIKPIAEQIIKELYHM